tara:strand:+ start:227 stop:490 length:264 start_codon:yes stop_codon:yes gene_type:complete
MKIDTYSKVILTGIAIFLGFIAFDYKPTINAQAGLMGGNEMIAALSGSHAFWHLKDGKIRFCKAKRDRANKRGAYYSIADCGNWSAG